jgi:ABC-type transport system substrate-binding protein
MQIAKSGGGMPALPALVAPSHYLKKFHPRYARKEELDKLATDRKQPTWADLWGKAGNMEGPIAFWFLNPDLPVVNAWKIDKPTPADPVVMVRNPYFWQVDDQGNQLPYIDSIEHTSTQGSAAADQHELIRKYWNAIGVRTTARAVERALYEEHVHLGEVEIGQWSWDRASVVKADPGRWTATIDDGPWAPLYGHWYNQSPYKKEEPPKDHWIRKIWSAWERTQVESDEAKRNATFQELIGLHRDAPVAIGVVGENISPMIAKNSFRNVRGGYIADDTLRDDGLINPHQFFIKK